MSIRDQRVVSMICYLSLTQVTVHSDIKTLSGAEVDINCGDRQKVSETDDGVPVNESENSEKVTIVYCI